MLADQWVSVVRSIDLFQAGRLGKAEGSRAGKGLGIGADRAVAPGESALELQPGLLPALGAFVQVGDGIGDAGQDQRLRAHYGARQPGAGNDDTRLCRWDEVGEVVEQFGPWRAHRARHMKLRELFDGAAVEDHHITTGVDVALERGRFDGRGGESLEHVLGE